MLAVYNVCQGLNIPRLFCDFLVYLVLGREYFKAQFEGDPLNLEENSMEYGTFYAWYQRETDRLY